MKAGTKVKVIERHAGHDFDIGEIVTRVYLEYDGVDGCGVGFKSDINGEWYMDGDEYVVLESKTFALDALKECITNLEALSGAEELASEASALYDKILLDFVEENKQ
tara:strand:+ start:22128 stop:22448 length:321 start_codon:yes stop_codon:yes gene_type:complete